MAAIFKFFFMILLAAFAMAQEYGHGGYGHEYSHHEPAISTQNQVLHAYHPVPVVYKKSYGHGGY